MKKLITLVIMTALLLTSLSGCIIIDKSDPTEGGKVVAKVNGESVTYDKFYAIYSQYVTMYNAYGYSESDPNYASIFQEMRQAIIDELVLEKVLLQKCKEAGLLPLNEDDKQKVTELLQADIDEYKKSIIENAKTTDGENQRTDEEYAELAEEELRKFYETTSSYDELFTFKTNDYVISKLKEDQTKDITVSDTEIQEYYNQSLEDQKDAFEDFHEFEDAYNAGETIFYNLEGYRVVSHILIPISNDEATKISNLRKEAATAKSSASSETDETKKAEYLATEKAKTDEANQALNDALKKIEDKLEEVLTKIDSGEDFDELITEYSSDSNNNGAGYLVGPDTDDFMESFSKEALRLQTEKEISEQGVASDYGYHILRLDKLIIAGEVPLEDLKTQITESLLYSKQSARWDALQTEWQNAAEIEVFNEVITPSSSPSTTATA